MSTAIDREGWNRATKLWVADLPDNHPTLYERLYANHGNEFVLFQLANTVLGWLETVGRYQLLGDDPHPEQLTNEAD